MSLFLVTVTNSRTGWISISLQEGEDAGFISRAAHRALRQRLQAAYGDTEGLERLYDFEVAVAPTGQWIGMQLTLHDQGQASDACTASIGVRASSMIEPY